MRLASIISFAPTRGKAAILSKSLFSLVMASLVMRRTSSGECVQAGGGWGGVRVVAMVSDIDEEEENENRPESVDCDLYSGVVSHAAGSVTH